MAEEVIGAVKERRESDGKPQEESSLMLEQECVHNGVRRKEKVRCYYYDKEKNASSFIDEFDGGNGIVHRGGSKCSGACVYYLCRHRKP